MTTEKDRPGETIPLEQTEAFEIAAMKDPGIARVELAQSGVTPIEVHRPAAGTIIPGFGASFVDSEILHLTYCQLTIGDAVGNEGDKLVFDVSLSNAQDHAITLDLTTLPLTTVNTDAATPGVDFAADHFEFSTDGGVTWQAAGGPNGTSVTFDPGQTDLKVRIETFTDGTAEGDESFLLTVANKNRLDACDIASVVDGAGYIFDGTSPPPPNCNPPPQANDGCATSACGAPVTIAVLANDSDPDGDPIKVQAFTYAQHGTLTLNDDGTFTYAPVAGFTGTDSFVYAIDDGWGGSDTAVVRITVERGDVCDCEITPPPCEIPPPPCDLPPPPQDCDGPRRDWSNNRGNLSASTNAAFAALIGPPLAEELQNHDDNGRNWQSGDDHHGDGRHGSHTQNASGPGDDAGGGWTWSNGNDDHRGRNGSDGETEHSSGWKWTNWDDRGDSQESHSNHSSGDRGSNGWPSSHETGPQPDSGDGPTGPHIMAGPAMDPQGGQNGSAMPVISGTAGDDTLVAKAGFAEIHGGAGFDTFKFDDSGVLDLSLLSGKVTGIEKADITGTGNVELKLTVQDLLTMTDSGHQLTIVGDSGDKVSADLSGHNVAVTDMGAFTRYVIDGGAATLDIDNHVQKNIVGI